MPLVPLTNATELEERIGSAARLTNYTQGNANKVTDAIVAATDMFRSAAMNRYTVASIDALTIPTCPAEAKFHIESLALEILASDGSGREAEFTPAAERARKWLGYLVGGTAQMDTLVKLGSTVSGGTGTQVRVGAPSKKNKFDPDETESDYAVRDIGI